MDWAKQLEGEMENIEVLGFGATDARGLPVLKMLHPTRVE